MPTLPREQCWLKCQERINTQKRLPLTPQSGFKQALRKKRASRVAQRVKNRLQCRRPGFDPWVGKIPWRREGLPTPVFWPGEFHGLYNPWGHKESDTSERLSLSLDFPLTFLLSLRSTFGLFIAAASLADLGSKWGLKCPQRPPLKEKSGHKPSPDTLSLHLSHAVRFSHLHK